MKDRSTPLSIKLLYWLSSLTFAFFMLALVVVLILVGLKYAGFNFGRPFLTFELPVAFGGEIGFLSYAGEEIDVLFNSAFGKITFPLNEAPEGLIFLTLLTLLVILLIGTYLSWTFRKFMKNVRNGLIFDVYNISILKHLSYGLVCSWLVVMVYQRILYYKIVQHIRFDHLLITNDFDNHEALLLASLFLWVLSHIFITGMKMKEELDLTV